MILNRLVANRLILQIGFKVHRFGYLKEDFARIFEQCKQTTDSAGFVLGAEKNIDQGRNRPMGVFAEKHELRDDIYRTLGRFLQFNQVLNGVSFGFDKATIKPFFAHQRKHAGLAFYQALSDITTFIRVGKRPLVNKVIEVRQYHFY